MNIWRSIAGTLEVEVTGAELEQTLSAVNEIGIEICHLQRITELTCSFLIARADYRGLKKLCGKRGDTLKLCGRRGIFWWIKGILHRPVMLVGIILLIALILFLPTRVLFISVEGNSNIPPKQILDAAEACGIRFGASRREVRSEKVKNALLSAVPDLQWVGVNTSGCLAVISVRERTDTEVQADENTFSNIIASRDGYILSGEATQGNALFQPGQTVKQGQILISGYSDCGICIRATRAQGEIFAQTNRRIEAVTPDSYLQRTEKTDSKRKISLVIRKKRINLWKDSGIPDATCGRMYKEYYFTLPGGFQLPLALCLETYTSYSTAQDTFTQTDAAGLQQFADQYLLCQMIAGEILQKDCDIISENGAIMLSGHYVCTEMIGREQRE